MIDFVRISAILNLIFYIFLGLISIRLRSLCFWEISKFVISKTLIWFAVESFDDDVESFCTLLWPLIVDFDIDLIFIFVEVIHAFMLVLFCYSICQSILLFRLCRLWQLLFLGFLDIPTLMDLESNSLDFIHVFEGEF